MIQYSRIIPSYVYVKFCGRGNKIYAQKAGKVLISASSVKAVFIVCALQMFHFYNWFLYTFFLCFSFLQMHLIRSFIKANNCKHEWVSWRQICGILISIELNFLSRWNYGMKTHTHTHHHHFWTECKPSAWVVGLQMFAFGCFHFVHCGVKRTRVKE